MRLTALTVLCATFAVVELLLLCSRPTPAVNPRRMTTLLEPSPPEVAVLERRMRVKSQLARRIVAERTLLLEAAEWFRQANGEDGVESLIRTMAGRSVREKLCRQVVIFVADAEHDMEQEGNAPTGPRVSLELQAEFDQLLAAGAFPPEPGME